MNPAPVLAVDVDNTLTEYHDFSDYSEHPPKHWISVYEKLKPVQKVIDWVKAKNDDGWRIVIFTARDDIYEDVTIKWLKKHKVPYEWVQMKKPFYNLFLEDRSIRPEEIE